MPLHSTSGVYCILCLPHFSHFLTLVAPQCRKLSSVISVQLSTSACTSWRSHSDMHLAAYKSRWPSHVMTTLVAGHSTPARARHNSGCVCALPRAKALASDSVTFWTFSRTYWQLIIGTVVIPSYLTPYPACFLTTSCDLLIWPHDLLTQD